MTFAPYMHRMVHAAEELCKELTRDGRPLIEHASARRRLARATANVLAADCLRKRILFVDAENKPNFAYGPASKLVSAEAYRRDSFDLLNLTAPESLV